MEKRKKIGELLIEKGIITQEQLETALRIQQEVGGRLGSILLKQNFIDPDELLDLLESQKGIRSRELGVQDIDPAAVKMLRADTAVKCKAVPISFKDNVLYVGMADPNNFAALDEIRFASGVSRVKAVLAFESNIQKLIDYFYKPDQVQESILHDGTIFMKALQHLQIGESEKREESEEEEVSVIDLKEEAEEKPIVNSVNFIILQAIRMKAGDIHIEPHQDSLRVRYRIDGMLHDVFFPPVRLHRALISRIKVISNMDISVRRKPQDGHLKARYEDETIDFRVSTLPTVFGEKAVLRILKKDVELLSLERLGFNDKHLGTLKEIAKLPQGMILVTGPTGSGKTSTIHACLNYLNNPMMNIVTLEDPVEYTFKGINHVNIRSAGGVTFADGLRSILRQDPDIIVVGEIRDAETADIAMRASITGHLVISTVHTLGAPETIVRLRDMGIDDYLISSSIAAIIAQRLVRVICPECKQESVPDPELLRRLSIDGNQRKNMRFYKGLGCDNCKFTGYKGRTALYEILVLNKKMQRAIAERRPIETIEELAFRNGFERLINRGFERILQGVTTLEEVVRVTSYQHDDFKKGDRLSSSETPPGDELQATNFP